MTTPTETHEQKREYYYQVEQLASVNAFIDVDIDGEPVRFQVTNRYSAQPEKIAATTKAAIEAFRLLRKDYPRPSHTTAPAQTTTVTPPTNGNGEKKAYEQRPVPVDELPEGLPTGEYFADEFDYFVVEPQLDDKVTIKFFKDSLKFPVGAHINKWKNARAVEALQSLSADFDPAKPNKIRVAGRQFWTQGNTYTKSDGTTGHYKDFRAAVQTF